jgi:mono/diheme cytochrome c family protein
MTARSDTQRERRTGGLRPGHDPERINGLARINLETGVITRFNESRRPSTGAMLTTAGGLVFNGDIYRYLRAFDDETGQMLWETRLGGPVTVSTVTYAARGKQYIAVITGDNMATSSLARLLHSPDHITGHNAVYVFTLPEMKESPPRVSAAGAPALTSPSLSSGQDAIQAVQAVAATRTPAAVTATGPEIAGMPAAAANLEHGEEIYFQVCQACHGDDGQGGPGGGMPLTDMLTVDTIMAVLYSGRNTMPEFGSVYSEHELRDVATYVLEKLLKL